MAIGRKFPETPRKTALFEAEEWYQKLLAARLGREYEPIKRSNFGEYDMAVNYLTSVLEEAKSIEKIAVFNIDHMAQIVFSGADAVALLDRVLPADVASMKIGQCKYTLLLNEQGGVMDDMILMRMDEDRVMIVINAGHDLTGKGIDHGVEVEKVSDADFILRYKKDGEEVTAEDISDDLVKIDIQGPYSYKLIAELYGNQALRNRNNPAKNMGFFSFNEFDYNGDRYIISRTGYTNRWGWELYVPTRVGEAEFKRIVEGALDMGGMLVGLGGRDENRMSAGPFGLPLMGQEYRPDWMPTNTPLFGAAIDMNKASFVGKEALLADQDNDQRLCVIITEGIVTDRVIFRDGKKVGAVTSSINSPNVPLEKRQFIGSKRKAVNDEQGTAAIGIGWFEHNPFDVDAEGKDVLAHDDKAVRIPLEFYRLDDDGNPKGKPILGYLSGDGVTPATAPRPLKNIENL